jgi:hypothetical protein
MNKEKSNMEKVATGIGGTFMAIAAIMIFVPCATFFGAVAGWIVGLFFGDTILGVVSQFGLRGITMWQFGAFMGFVGGFLKTKVTAEVKAAKS